MNNWNQEKLENAGYKIENAKITCVDLSMADYGCLTLKLCLEGKGWGAYMVAMFLDLGMLELMCLKGQQLEWSL